MPDNGRLLRRAAAIVPALAALAAFVPAAAASDPLSWQPVGPPTGSIAALAVAPSDGDRVYAATDGGVARSDDGGLTWAWPGAWGIAPSTVAVSPEDEDTVAGFGRAGVARSTDGGATWTSVLDDGSTSGTVAFAPSDGSVAYAALAGDGSGRKIERSADGGASWHATATAPPADAVRLVVDPAAATTVYAETDHETIYRSTDSGGHWTRLDSSLGRALISITPDRLQPGRLFATTPQGVLLSADNGATWRRPAAGILGTTGREPIIQDAADPNRLWLVTSGGLWTSADTGMNWASVDGSPVLASDGTVAPLVAGDAGGELLGPVDAGVAATVDAGRSWHSGSLPSADMVGLALGGGTIFAATVNGSSALQASGDGGDSWAPAGPTAATDALAMSATGSTVYISTPQGVFRSLDGGATWARRSSQTPATLFADPDQDGLVFADDMLSTDGGATWTSDAVGSPSGAALGLNVLATAPRTVLLATSSGLSRSVGGAAWMPVADLGSGPVGAVSGDPARPAVAYAASANGTVFRTADGGATWRAGTAPDGGVIALAADPAHPGVIHAATRAGDRPGLWQSGDGGTSWTRADGAAGGALVSALVVGADGTTYAATFGRSVYRLAAAALPPPAITVAPHPSLTAGTRLGAGVPVRVGWQASGDPASYDLELLGPAERQLHPVEPSALIGIAPGVPTTARVRAVDGAGRTGAFVAGAPFTATLPSEASSALTYAGGWVRVTASDLVTGAARQATAVGANAHFTFTGRGVAWIATRGPQRGSARVFVDGRLAGTINLRAEVRSTRTLVFARNFPAAGTHMLAISVTGGGSVDVDALAVIR